MYLGLGIVIALSFASGDWPALIGIDQVINIVALDTRRAGIHQRCDISLSACFNNALCTLHIDLVEETSGGHVVIAIGGSGVNYYIWLDGCKDLIQSFLVCDVTFVVCDA